MERAMCVGRVTDPGSVYCASGVFIAPWLAAYGFQDFVLLLKWLVDSFIIKD